MECTDLLQVGKKTLNINILLGVWMSMLGRESGVRQNVTDIGETRSSEKTRQIDVTG